jgi:hypothetical protein
MTVCFSILVKYQTLGGMYDFLRSSQRDYSHCSSYSGQEYELLDWLKHSTFPLEARYKDESFAKRVYSTVVRRIVDAGVRTICVPAITLDK